MCCTFIYTHTNTWVPSIQELYLIQLGLRAFCSAPGFWSAWTSPCAPGEQSQRSRNLGPKRPHDTMVKIASVGELHTIDYQNIASFL